MNKTRKLPSHQQNRMQALKGEVRGQYRVLSILTWTTSVLALLFLVLLSWDRPIAALFVGHALAVPYNLVALVGVWRSAARYGGWRICADLARIVSLVGMVLLSLI